MDLRTAASQHTSVAPRTLVEISQWRATHQSGQEIYMFLSDDGKESVTLTYADLDRKARAFAAYLQSLQPVGSRALILYPPSIEYIVAFWGCLYAGVIAIPAYPPRLNRSLARLQSIIEDARPEVILTDTRTLTDIQRKFAQTPALELARWVATDTIDDSLADTWQEPRITEDSLAFLQYSSGSTSAPKGIMVSHKNLVHNNTRISEISESSSNSRGVTWLPPYHDMGLIGSIIQPLYIGFPMVCMSPFSFLQRPFRWLQAISDYRATHTAAPDFAYALCARKITPEERATLDLRSWKLAFCGAEPIHPDTLDRFVEAFEPCGFKRETFYPCYGLAEGTLLVTGGGVREEPVVRAFDKEELLHNHAIPVAPSDRTARLLVGCGQKLVDQKLLIVDPQTAQPCPPNHVGEIWVAGPSVAQGYWNKPDETARAFEAVLADTGEGPFMRTGDAGFLLEDELFIAGRLKDLIIIRGSNYYPQDIEATAGKSHPTLRENCTAAFSVEVANEEQLVIVQEVDRQARNLDPEAVCLAIREAVMEQHDVLAQTIVLIKHGSIPKTSSGKIQRYACRQDFLKQRLTILGKSVFSDAHQPSSATYKAPRTPLEQIIAKAWEDVLGVEQVGIEDDFFALGGNSLLATQLLSLLQDIFQKEIPLRLIFGNSTISGIIQNIDSIDFDEDDEDEEPELLPLRREQYASDDV